MPPTLTKSAPRGARTVEELVDALEQEIGYRHQEAVAAKAATQEDRRARISAEAHIERQLRLAGKTRADVATLQRAIVERPHLYDRLPTALHVCEKRIVNPGHWRIAPPAEHESLLSSVVESADPADVEKLARQLMDAGANGYLLCALAFQRVAARAPELFGAMTAEEEAERANGASARVRAAEQQLGAVRERLLGLAARLAALTRKLV